MLATTKRKLADAWSYLSGEDKRRREAEESRHNCFRWSTLPPDIICLIVHHLDHSEGSATFSVDGNKGVVRMTMTCKEWRAAVPKEEKIDWHGRMYTKREIDHEYETYDPKADIEEAGRLLKAAGSTFRNVWETFKDTPYHEGARLAYMGAADLHSHDAADDSGE